ncbi:MAG: hypothetical protein WD036_06405 [Bauldia sp.]
MNRTVRRLQHRLNGWIAVPVLGRLGITMLRDGLLLAYCCAVGFVCAGISASCFKMVTSEPARFRLLGEGWLGLTTTFFFCGLTGPAIIMDYALHRQPSERNFVSLLVGGVCIAGLWSACSGVLVLHLVVTLGGRLA